MLNHEVLDRLKSENKDFKKWDELHGELESKLETFNRLKYLTSEEELEKKRLQKQKLLAKDCMQRILYKFSK